MAEANSEYISSLYQFCDKPSHTSSGLLNENPELTFGLQGRI